jgi:hypothetical protein
VVSAWEQRKLEARKMLAAGAARREAAVPSAQFIIILVLVQDAVLGGVIFQTAISLLCQYW